MLYDYRAFQPRSGYRPVYRSGETNHCPGCGRSQWVIGRATAECAWCATALPLTAGGYRGAGLFRSHRTAAPLFA